MILTIVYPSIVVAVDKGSTTDGGHVVVLELTATSCIQVGSRDGTVVYDDRLLIFNGYLAGNSHGATIDQPAIAVGRQFVDVKSTVIVDV